MLRAIATPIESEPPPSPPPATATDADTMVAAIAEVEVASIVTSSALLIELPSTYAFVCDRMVLVASAPAALAAPPPTNVPAAIAAEAATETASIVTRKRSNDVPRRRITYAAALRTSRSSHSWSSASDVTTSTSESPSEGSAALIAAMFDVLSVPSVVIAPFRLVARLPVGTVSSAIAPVVALSSMFPTVESSVGMFLMYASTRFATRLFASATAIEMAIEMPIPNAMPTDAAPTFAVMRDASVALRATRSASVSAGTPLATSPPSMNALTSVETRLSAFAPAPVAPSAPAPPAIATENASTSASIVLWERASAVRSPVASTPDATTYARTSDGCSVSEPPLPVFQPIRLRASETPIDAPTPTKPADTATDAPTTTALMLDVSLASRSTSPAPTAVPFVLTLLFLMKALVRVRMTLVLSAPAPLTANVRIAALTASEAATVMLSITALLVALITTLPVRAVTWSVTSLIAAMMSLSTSLRPIDTPIETLMPTLPAKPAAIEAPTPTATIRELSVAVSETEFAETPLIVAVDGPLPVIVALTSATIAFVADEPAPLTPMPAVEAAPTATETATTTALIVSLEVAVTVRLPSESTAVDWTNARTSNGSRSPAAS